MNVDRVLARKQRLTRRLAAVDWEDMIGKEEGRISHHRPRPKATLIRAQIHRCDVLLERAGAFK